MDNLEQLKQASDPATSVEDLMTLAGHAIEVDRALARHPSATAELLESIMYAEDEDGNFDREVRTSVVQHPNVSTATFCELSAQYPKDAIKNPSMDALLKANSELLVSCSALLELEGCPEGWLKRGASSSWYPVKLQTLRNPKLTEKFVLDCQQMCFLKKLKPFCRNLRKNKKMDLQSIFWRNI